MKLSDVAKRLQAPFPAHMVDWKPGVMTKDRKRALMMPYIDARAVMDRLDAICPEAWSFEVQPIESAKVPTMIGTLTVLGVSRSDVGEGDPSSEAGNSYKAAASDALKRCAVHFGIGRYLYDLPKIWAEWDDTKRQPKQKPELPEWAKPDHERSAGGKHLVQAMDQLRYEMPEDLDMQREVYKHLKAALGSLHPLTASQQPEGRESETEGHTAARKAAPVPERSVVGGISKGTKQQIAAHLDGPRWGFKGNRDGRIAFTAWLANLSRPISSSEELTEAEGLDALRIIQTCKVPAEKLAEWQAEKASAVA